MWQYPIYFISILKSKSCSFAIQLLHSSDLGQILNFSVTSMNNFICEQIAAYHFCLLILSPLAFQFPRTKRHFRKARATIQVSIWHIQRELSQGQLVTIAKVKVCCPYLIKHKQVCLKKEQEKWDSAIVIYSYVHAENVYLGFPCAGALLAPVNHFQTGTVRTPKELQK